MNRGVEHRRGYETFSKTQEILAEELIESGTIQFPVEMGEGSQGVKLCVHLPALPLRPNARRFATFAFKDLCPTLSFDFVADACPTAPLACDFALACSTASVTSHFLQSLGSTGVDGRLRRGQKAVVVTGSLAAGEEVLGTVRQLDQVGIVVCDVLVLLDLEQAGRACLEREGLLVHTVFRLRELLKHYVRTGKLDRATFRYIRKFLSRTISRPQAQASDAAAHVPENEGSG